jgi:hypothetical protein
MQSKEKRVVVNLKEFKMTISEIKENKGLFLRQISLIIGTNVKNYLYGTTNSLSESSIIKLTKLANKKIEYSYKEKDAFKSQLKKSESLAELIGIILGDGGLYRSTYRVQISFNGIDDIKYVYYVKNLLTRLFYLSPKEYWEKNKENADGTEKGMILYYYSKKIFCELISHGIISGNKMKNQISGPNWIKKNKIYKIACLRGLFDTDGSLHLYLKRPCLRLEFSNASLSLIKDFYEICTSLDIKPQPRIIKRKWKSKKNRRITHTYKVVITAKSYVSKFLYLIKPKKWLFHSQEISEQLNKIGLSIKDVFFYKEKYGNNYYANKIIKEFDSINSS